MKIISCTLIMATLMLLLTGCWDRSEIEELAIVVALGIDFDPEQEEFEVTAAVARPQDFAIGEQAGGGAETKPFRLVTTRGATLSGALEQKNALLPRSPLFAHNDVVIIGEDLARKGLHLVLDRLVRERDMRITLNMVVTRENVKELMRSGARIEQGFPLELRQMLLVRHQRSQSPVDQLNVFLTNLLQAGADPVLPLLSSRPETPTFPQEIEQAGQVEEKDKIRYPKLSGAAVFREDKLVGFLEAHETKGLLYVKGDILDARETIEDPFGKPGKVVLITLHADTRITPLWENDRPRVLLEVEEEGDICCLTSASNIFTGEAFHKMQKEKEKIIKAHIRAALEKSQEWKADIFGIGREFHRRMPDKWDNLEHDWREIYADLEVDIKVSSRIRRTGLIERPTFYEYHAEEEER